MDANHKKLLPIWTNNLGTKQFNLIASNDADSIISCALWSQKYNFKIKHFYDFSNLWSIKGFKDDPIDRLGVDISIVDGGACVDNHVQQMSFLDEVVNEQALNLSNVENVCASGDSYFRKYNLNTILLSMSVLDIPLPEDQECLGILLAVDSAFKGWYTSHKRDNLAIKKYLKILQFESLIELLESKDEQYFLNIQKQYNLKSKIHIQNGRLKSSKDLTKLEEKLKTCMDIDIKLPTDQFEVIQRFGIQSSEIPRNTFLTKQEPIDKGIRLYSLAMQGRRYFSLSYYI